MAKARAQQLEVSRVSVTFRPEQRAVMLIVTNRENAALTMQVRALQWREDHGVAELLPTAGLSVSPTYAELGPGKPQTIRLLLRQAPGAAESTDRLLVDKLPSAPYSVKDVGREMPMSSPVQPQPVRAERVIA